MTEAHGVVVERPSAAVLQVRLDRPERLNAQTPEMWRALAEIGRTLPAQVRAVVLTGSGTSFSAGLDRSVLADVAGLGTADRDTVEATIAAYQDAFTCWRQPGILSVAAVGGHAIGAGFQLALACDLRICADDVSFAMAETTLGLVPDLGGTGALVRAVGEAAAVELCLTGRRIGGQEALRLGLAQLVVPRADLDAAVHDLLAAVLASPAGATAATLDLVRGAGTRAADDQLAAERAAQTGRLRALADQAAGAVVGEAAGTDGR